MDPYVGEIRLFAGPYIPENWIACNGQLLDINEYQVLFTLVGTMYGGNGSTTFGVPNLQVALTVGQSGGAVPPGFAYPYPLAGTGGAYEVALAEANLPMHGHAVNVSTSAATTLVPGPTVTFATVPTGYNFYYAMPAPTPTPTPAPPTPQALSASAISTVGGGQPHNNMMPTLVINYIICGNGIFPQFP